MPDWNYLARLEDAERNKRIAAERAVANGPVESVVHVAVDDGVRKESVVVHAAGTEGRYKDREARKAYRREWMRANRARRKVLKLIDLEAPEADAGPI